MTDINHANDTMKTSSIDNTIAKENTIYTAKTASKKVSSRQSMRNKMAAAIGGAALLAGAFAFAPTLTSEGAPVSGSEATKIQSESVNSSSTKSSTAVVQAMPVASSYQNIARQAAIRNGINPDLFVRQIQQESGFNPNARSYAGAQGIAQFMPATAAAMGVNPHDPVSALNGAARLMADLNRQFGGNYAKALAAYNAGPGNVQYAVSAGGGNWLAHTPAETQHYVHKILG